MCKRNSMEEKNFPTNDVGAIVHPLGGGGGRNLNLSVSFYTKINS